VQCCYQVALKRPTIVYLNISQGTWGYIRDLGFLIPALVFQRKVVIHLRGSEFHVFFAAMPKFLRWVTRSVFKRVCRVIVLGHTLKHVFKDLVPNERIAVVPNGINYLEFGDVSLSAESFQPRILYLSSLRKRKGVFQIIEALPAIISRYPTVRVTFAGEWQSAEDKRAALALIQASGVDEHVEFVGEVTGREKIQLYRQHGVFVFTPVEPEGLPWVLLEAMSAGLPVVTSNQGAISEVVEHGQTGYIVNPVPKEIAGAICYLLDHHEEASRMGLSGRRRIERYFSEVEYMNGLERVFWEAVRS